MQEICRSNTPVVTGICDTNKSQVQHHYSLRPGSKLKYLRKMIITDYSIMFVFDGDTICLQLKAINIT